MSQLKEAQALVKLRKKLAEVSQVRAIRKKAEAKAEREKAIKEQNKADGFVDIRKQKRKEMLDDLIDTPKTLIDMDKTVGRVNQLGEKQEELFRKAKVQHRKADDAKDAAVQAEYENTLYQKRENASENLLKDVRQLASAEEEAFEMAEVEDIQKAVAALPPPEEI